MKPVAYIENLIPAHLAGLSTPCHECTSHSKSDFGYAFFVREGKRYRIHRYVYISHYGEIPVGNVICHKCDNPSCINIDHLYMGTQADNMRDMIQRGRGKYEARSGNDHPMAKANEQMVREIWFMLRMGFSVTELAKHAPIKQPMISHIKARRHWAHLEYFN